MHRILYVSHTSRLGGGEHSLLLLLGRLDHERFAPGVIVPEPGPLTDRLDAMHVPWYTVPMVRFERTTTPVKLVRYFFCWRRAVRKLRKLVDQVDVHLVHANSTAAFLFAAQLLGKQKVPRIWHVRDFSLTGIRWIDRAMARSALAIIAISEPIRKSVPRVSGVGEKTTVIHNGVDTAEFAPVDRTALRREFGIGEGTPLVGIVGQVVPWKGHERFLEVAAKVSERLPDAKFLVAGDNRFGDFPGILDQLKDRAAKLGLRDRVLFPGWRDDAAAVMNALDLLLVTSDNEPFGRVVIEAMACGKPVVSFRCGGPVEIIEHGKTGLLVRPHDTASMADEVVRLMSDPAASVEMGRRARQVVRERFSADLCAAKVQEVYARLLG